MRAAREVCDASNTCRTEVVDWSFKSAGPGRLSLSSSDVEQDLQFWVLWVDEGFRTAAIGTPDGSFGWILDRKRTGGPDRIAAARDVLEFNGYDISKIVVRQ